MKVFLILFIFIQIFIQDIFCDNIQGLLDKLENIHPIKPEAEAIRQDLINSGKSKIADLINYVKNNYKRKEGYKSLTAISVVNIISEIGGKEVVIFLTNYLNELKQKPNHRHWSMMIVVTQGIVKLGDRNALRLVLNTYSEKTGKELIYPHFIIDQSINTENENILIKLVELSIHDMETLNKYSKNKIINKLQYCYKRNGALDKEKTKKLRQNVSRLLIQKYKKGNQIQKLKIEKYLFLRLDKDFKKSLLKKIPKAKFEEEK